MAAPSLDYARLFAKTCRRHGNRGCGFPPYNLLADITTLEISYRRPGCSPPLRALRQRAGTRHLQHEQWSVAIYGDCAILVEKIGTLPRYQAPPGRCLITSGSNKH